MQVESGGILEYSTKILLIEKIRTYTLKLINLYMPHII